MKPLIYQHTRSGLWICEGTDIKWAPIVRYCSGLTAEIAFEKWSNSSGIKEASSEAIELAWEMEKLRRKNKDAMLLKRASMVDSLKAVREIVVSKMFPDETVVIPEPQISVPKKNHRSVVYIHVVGQSTRLGTVDETVESDGLRVLLDEPTPMLWEECHVLH